MVSQSQGSLSLQGLLHHWIPNQFEWTQSKQEVSSDIDLKVAEPA